MNKYMIQIFRRIGAGLVAVCCMNALYAQYPTIPDSVMQRGKVEQALWDSLDQAAWQRAVPVVMAEMLAGKPYVPWSDSPDDLPQAPIPAFPGAEGGGRYAFGGRGGRIFVVTSLADDGPGTLREACEAGGARMVVFNVAGEIRLQRPVHVRAPYITIAGQTAPGDGVVITGHTLHIDTHDVVLRHLRFRRGATDVACRDDACGGNGIGNIIYDHCSASWGLDEVMSMYRHVYARDEQGRGRKLPTVNITIQDCIFAEALDLYNHGFGASIGGHNTLFVRNLFANNISRNPSIAMNGDFNFVNNVLYNWWNRSVDGGDRHSQFNIINNYYKPGPVTFYRKGEQPDYAHPPKVAYRILKPEASRDETGDWQYGKAYVAGNYVHYSPEVTADNWAGGVQPSDLGGQEMVRETLCREEPFPMPYLDTLFTAEEAYERVLEGVGATKPCRDAVDARIVRSVRTGEAQYAPDARPCESPYVKRRLPADSYKYGIITHPQQVGGLPRYEGQPRPDDDGDGIPNDWEQRHGLDKDNPDDARQIREDGYMVIEWYINQL